MRVAVFDRPHQPLRIESRPTPVPGNREVLIKVQKCGVCRTDIHWTEENARTAASGTILGHEFAGEVVALGEGVDDLRLGDRVCAVPFKGCGTCDACTSGDPFWCKQKKSTWGGFGQYTLAAASNCVKLPDHISSAEGALVEPLSSGLHAVRLAQLSAGVTALVIGVGPIGLACVYWLRRLGASSIVVTARTARSRDLALSMGATSFELLEEKSPQAASQTPPPDVVFECAGAPGLVKYAMQRVRPRGSVIVAGLCMQPDEFEPALGISKQLRVQFVAAYSVDDFRSTVEALGTDSSPRRMITSIVSLDELPAAFEAVRNKSDQCKLMVDPWAGAPIAPESAGIAR